MTALLEAFAALPKPSTVGSYAAEPARGQRCRVGRSAEGHPAVLIAFKHEVGSTAIRLATLDYRPPAEVEVFGGGAARARLAILECKTTDPQLIGYFFRVVDAVVFRDARTEDEAIFASALDAIVTLFRALQRPGMRTVQGLWTELAIILWSSNPATAASAWHSNIHGLHDFSAGSFRLEVKSTLKDLREHSFMLDQLSSMSPGITLIASVLLVEESGGTSVMGLVEMIRARIVGATDVERRIEVIVGESLGQSWKEADAIRFDLESARESLRIYAADKVPTIPQPLPVGVKDVRFTADLSDVEWLETSAARGISNLYADLLPVGG